MSFNKKIDISLSAAHLQKRFLLSPVSVRSVDDDEHLFEAGRDQELQQRDPQPAPDSGARKQPPTFRPRTSQTRVKADPDRTRKPGKPVHLPSGVVRTFPGANFRRQHFGRVPS